jgi:hypothetical protein
LKNKYKNFIAFVLTFGLYFAFLELVNSGTKCIFKNTTGIPCPGCGMTRSFLHLFHGELPEAFHDHPLFFTIPIILVISLLLNVYKDNIKLKKVLVSILSLIVIAFVVVFIIRMVLFFPETDPLKFYERGIIPSVYRFVRDIIKAFS